MDVAKPTRLKAKTECVSPLATVQSTGTLTEIEKRVAG